MKNYKVIWDRLSADASGASLSVCATEGEDEIRKNGALTADFLRSVLAITPEDTVLEIGCGIARIGRELAQYCGEWHGADISGNMIRYAAERVEGIPNVYLHELPESSLSVFQDGYFDCVYSSIVFMHLDKPEVFTYIKEALRVLAPGGRAYFDTYNLVSPKGWKQFQKIVESFAPGERPQHASQFSTPQELLKYMEEAGFTDVHVEGNDNSQLVVALGRKPDQSGFERPATALRPREERARAGSEAAADGPARSLSDVITELQENTRAKDDYIARLEEAVAVKNAHIARLERLVKRQEADLSYLPVRGALRLRRALRRRDAR